MVPDVSLIMGNERQFGSSTLSSSTPISSRSTTRLPTTVTPITYMSGNIDLDFFWRELKVVKEAISRMEVKTDQLLEYQRDMRVFMEASLEASFYRNIKEKDLPPVPRRADEVHFGPSGNYSYCEPSSIKSLPLESFHR
jgi:methionine-rich copper-binding protein CopC